MAVVAPDLQLDDQHRYWRNGNEVPGVTRMLGDLGLTPPYPEDRGWLEFGRAVHKCTELFLYDRLDVTTTSSVLVPYVNGFAEKVQEMRIKPIKMEHRVYHDTEGYAGTLDILCTVFDAEEAIIDCKTGAPPECTALQLALYDLADGSSKGPFMVAGSTPWGCRKRYAFYLQPDRCIVKEYRDPYDYTAAIAAVRLWKWKYGNGRSRSRSTAA